MDAGGGHGHGGGRGRIIQPGQKPIVGSSMAVETGVSDPDLVKLLVAGEVPLAVWIQTLRNVRRMEAKLDALLKSQRIDIDGGDAEAGQNGNGDGQA